MKKSFLVFIYIFVISLPVYAQLSQLEFEEISNKPKIEVVPDALTDSEGVPGSIEEAERKEREAMEAMVRKNQKEQKQANPVQAQKDIEQAEPEKKVIEKASYKGLQVPIASYGIDYTLLPPKLRGPIVDEGSENLITSNSSWPKGRKGSCSQPRNESGFLKKSESLQEVFTRFSGSNDYYDILNSEICSERCDDGINEPFISSVLFSKGSNARLTLRSVDKGCFFQLNKNKEMKWKVQKIDSVVCSCISKRMLKSAK